MGISGEDKLSEMVRDFLESDSSLISAYSDQPLHQVDIIDDHHHLSIQVLHLCILVDFLSFFL